MNQIQPKLAVTGRQPGLPERGPDAGGGVSLETEQEVWAGGSVWGREVAPL